MSDIKKALEFIDNYKWSSYKDHISEKRREFKILDLSVFPNYFSTIKDFNKEILAWLKYKNED